ncbi:MAG: hypothetical protein DMG65_07215 [Candidatus Angelobacter sp. Gp1-AA117]|nr:MAG: hypothetical protein DMG65_07215 [Candidatus Angelobacter sp. Gp1-AA117]
MSIEKSTYWLKFRNSQARKYFVMLCAELRAFQYRGEGCSAGAIEMSLRFFGPKIVPKIVPIT